jgi:hypothetical protein
MTGPPPRLIFLHIPKTGGTTLRTVLARQYDPSEVWLQTAEPPRRRVYVEALREGRLPVQGELFRGRNEAQERLRNLPFDRLEGLRFVAGHFWYGVHEMLPGPSTYITTLRDPVDRVLSLYHHRVTYQGLDQSLEEYVRLGVDFDMHDGQTRRLSSRTGAAKRFEPVAEEDLRSAKDTLRNGVAVFGLTDRFDETLALMGRTFGWTRLGYARLAVGAGRPSRDTIPADLVALLEQYNRNDLELYRYARAIFEERLAAAPGIMRDVHRLRARNALLRRFPRAARVWGKARRAYQILRGGRPPRAA